MKVQIEGRYFGPLALDVTPELLTEMWESPATVGGGATRFRTDAGPCFKTKEGWGFSRSGSKAFGWVNLHDPNPGQGRVRWSSKAIQFEEQAEWGNPGAKGAIVVGSMPIAQESAPLLDRQNA